VGICGVREGCLVHQTSHHDEEHSWTVAFFLQSSDRQDDPGGQGNVDGISGSATLSEEQIATRLVAVDTSARLTKLNRRKPSQHSAICQHTRISYRSTKRRLGSVEIEWAGIATAAPCAPATGVVVSSGFGSGAIR